MPLTELRLMLAEQGDHIRYFERDGLWIATMTDPRRNDVAVCASGKRYIASVEGREMLYNPYRWVERIRWNRWE